MNKSAYIFWFIVLLLVILFWIYNVHKFPIPFEKIKKDKIEDLIEEKEIHD